MKCYALLSRAVVPAFLVLVIGCSKDKNPAGPPVPSYVDGYTVNLTEAKGTTYDGDFFPLNVGYTCNYSGSSNMTLSLDGISMGNTTGTTSGMFKVLALRSVPLTGGAMSLYPVVDLSVVGTQTTSDTTRFFLKDTAVYIKAMKLPDGSYMKVDSPLFIKSRLVVGDAWESAPQLNMAKILASQAGEGTAKSNLTLNARAKFFVVGKETIVLPSLRIRNAVRLEQANDISMSGTIVDSTGTYPIQMTARLAVVYHLIADTGIAHQNVTGTVDMTVSGMTFSIQFHQCELLLTGVNSGPVRANLAKAAVQPGPAFTSQEQAERWRLAQTIMQAVIKKLSL